MSRDFHTLEEKLGMEFKTIALLKEALTHRSYLNENPTWEFPHNERLEYLGDAVVELVISEALFKKFPDKDEGYLTSVRAALVNYQMLARTGREISLDKHILLSRGEAKDTGKAREVIVANAFEALVGAMYLDGGYAPCAEFLSRIVVQHLDEIVEKELYRDPKSAFQERAQETWKVTPSYRILRETGPDHDKRFFIGVFLDDKMIAEGEGTSKQEGELHAAENALSLFEKIT